MRFSATRRSAPSSTAAKSTPRASRAIPVSRVLPAAAVPERAAFDARLAAGPSISISISAAAAARVSMRRIFFPIFSAERGGGPRGAGRHMREPGADIALETHISLEIAIHGGKARVLMPSGKTLEVNIPAGVEEGKQIRLRGQGQPSPTGGPAGDALVTVRFAKHGLFRIEGRDLRLDLPISLYEAVLGAKVESPTLSGKVELTLPPHSNSGRTLRLRGKGLPAAGGLPAGDLLVTLRVVLPEGADADLEELMRRWREDKPYNPRAELKK